MMPVSSERHGGADTAAAGLGALSWILAKRSASGRVYYFAGSLVSQEAQGGETAVVAQTSPAISGAFPYVREETARSIARLLNDHGIGGGAWRVLGPSFWSRACGGNSWN
jgi:hypothetical protein